MREKNERKEWKSEEKDAVLRLAVTAAILLMAVGMIVVVIRLLNPKADTEQGLRRLQKMADADVAETDKKIQALEDEERAADEEWANRPASEKFVNAFVIGDSVTQGLYEYGVLDQAYVQADRGTEISKVNNTKLDEQVAKAKDVNPKTLFLAYGMNDIEAVRGDADVFVQAYQKVLEDLKASLPDTKIYVNGILPVQSFVSEENEWYGNIPEFNRKLEELCEEEKVTFIDNSSLVKEEYYAQDGIHMAPEYYTEWVNHMAEVAKL